MTIETDVTRARERVRGEQKWTNEKRAAFERFADTVADIDPQRGSTAAFGGATAVAATQRAGPSVGAVLDAFDEHLAAYSGDKSEQYDAVHEAVAAEFSADLAVSLCSGDSAGALTPELKRGVLSESERRRRELRVMERALDRETESLTALAEGLQTVCDWFVEYNPTPLSELGFEGLRARHERLETHRESLSDLAATRQEHVDSATAVPEQVGIEHRVLLEYLYADFEHTYPALSTITRLDETCQEAQRAVRDHLVRRA